MLSSRLFVLFSTPSAASDVLSAPVFKVDYVSQDVFRFAMEVDGIFYIAQVKQKEKAWRMYKEARARNQTAGLVDVEARHSNRLEMIDL